MTFLESIMSRLTLWDVSIPAALWMLVWLHVTFRLLGTGVIWSSRLLRRASVFYIVPFVPVVSPLDVIQTNTRQKPHEFSSFWSLLVWSLPDDNWTPVVDHLQGVSTDQRQTRGMSLWRHIKTLLRPSITMSGKANV